jgi:hypothetical protein
VGSPPLPPHERTWRHPSELAAAEWHEIRHAEPQRSTRAFAIATGTMGLVAVAMLMFTVTPRRQDSPVAISATTSPTAGFERAVGERAVSAGVRPAAVRVVTGALATPIGDGGRAVMTMSAAAARGTELDVQLTNGPVVTAVVDATGAGIVIVSISSRSVGHPIADTQPDPDEIVTVLADPPVTIAFSAVTTVDAEEGTPVLDGDGELIGLCSQREAHGDDSIALIDVTDDPTIDVPVVATTVAP